MVSVTSASRYITSTSRYHPRYQSRSSMYIRGLIPRNFAEMAEVVPFDLLHGSNNGSDKHTHSRSLISAFLIHFLESIIIPTCYVQTSVAQLEFFFARTICES